MSASLPLVSPKATVRDGIDRIDKHAKGIVLIVDDERRLVGTVTDGDVRRAILDGIDLNAPVTKLLDYHGDVYREPITAPVGTQHAELLRRMQAKSIRQIPLLDEEGRVVDLILLSDLIKRPKLGLPAVIMAGGYGSRLRPLTEESPKPLLPLGEKPILERIVEQLREAGITDVVITTRYQADKIIGYFGDGSRHGVHIRYTCEEKPMGTAGALGLIDEPFNTPFLVVNGDILTRLDFQALLDFHRDSRAVMTMCVKQYEVQMPYGLVKVDKGHVVGLSEKPSLNFFVNAGIYVLEPHLQRLIREGQPHDMTDLLQQLLDAGERVACFLIREYWLDIGQYEDYRRACEDVTNGEF